VTGQHNGLRIINVAIAIAAGSAAVSPYSGSGANADGRVSDDG